MFVCYIGKKKGGLEPLWLCFSHYTLPYSLFQFPWSVAVAVGVGDR